MNGLNLVFYADENLPKIDFPEDMGNLRDNAAEKAIAAAKETHMYTLGDDSGIFIKSLSGFPGVYSRRWYGDTADDTARNNKILEMMDGISDRSCYLESYFVLADPDCNIVWEGFVKNNFTISTEISGSYGFGYDPILIPEGYNFTIGECDITLKNKINNRGRIAKVINEEYFLLH